MVVCVHCGSAVPTLYHESSKESICLETCNHCGEIADKYVEWDLYITAIELFLLKAAVFRHLIYNQDATPSSSNGGTSRRKRMSHLFLLFASAVVLDGYRVMVTCRSLTQSQEWCSGETLMQQQKALERTKTFFQDCPSQTFTLTYDTPLSETDITPFPETGSTVNLLHNMVHSILASSQVKIINARQEMGICGGLEPNSVVDRFFLLALQDPALITLGKLTCKKFGEHNTLLLCLAKLAGYCTTLVLIQKMLSKPGHVRRPANHEKNNVKQPKIKKVNVISSTMDLLLAVLLCIHIKALVLMMIIWYPRLPLLGAVELYAYLSNVLAIHAACNITLKESATSVIIGIMVKLLIHYIWLRSHF